MSTRSGSCRRKSKYCVVFIRRLRELLAIIIIRRNPVEVTAMDKVARALARNGNSTSGPTKLINHSSSFILRIRERIQVSNSDSLSVPIARARIVRYISSFEALRWRPLISRMVGSRTKPVRLLPSMDGLSVSVGAAAAIETLPKEVRPTIQSL